MTPSRLRHLLVATLALAVALPVALAQAADDLPRYVLPVGRKLVYRSAGESKSVAGGDYAMTSSSSWQLTVVKENPDGSRRLIVRSASSYARSGAGGDAPERVEVGYADVFPDGKILPNPTLGMRMDPSPVLPPLPADAKQLSNGWMSENPEKLETVFYEPQKSDDAATFVFVSEAKGAINVIYQSTHKTTYRFDRAKGVVTAGDIESTQGYGVNTRGTFKTTLESDETISADQAAAMAVDFDRLFDVQKQYGEKMGGVDKFPNPDATLAEAKALIERAAGEAKTEDVKREFADLLKNHDRSAKYAKSSADEFKDVLNKPAADWQTTDIDGAPAKLADYRGKVVVMDFWYRGCGWCMYAMPQVKQLAEDYKDKPVAVLGMCTDANEKDARLVIEAMELKHPTIKSIGIPEKYGVQGFPTLVIVDQNGIVRDVHVGYSATLRKEVAKKIDELLAAPATTTTAPTASRD